MFQNLLRWMHGAGPRPEGADEADARLDELVERIDPRLRLVPGYRRKLLPGVRRLLAFSRTLGRLTDAPLPLSRQGYSQDRRVGLFFSSPASLVVTLRQSPAVQAFFAAPSSPDTAYALLVAQVSENQRYGMATDEGEVRSDVEQTVVSFDNHRLILPCDSLQGLAEAMQGRGLEEVVALIGAALHAAESRRVVVETELTRVRLRLSAAQSPGSVVIDSLAGEAPEDVATLSERLKALETELVTLREASGLESRLTLAMRLMEHPTDVFVLHPATLYLDRLGVKYDSNERPDVYAVSFEELRLGGADALRRAVVPVAIPRGALRDLEEEYDPPAF
ncbi:MULTISPECIES: hypothetical protein [Gulbenkiania]|uniref:Uncharacterized protein n=2 Tax=Gulbenkiania TaxID=397456 RepID=A0A0K6GVA0_9NEIS|nr:MULTISPECIES: hypothetical protein [Gulbenkiania]TCW29100.1 hypothetical protein EV669_11068 [Gulbenkiania mobilis]CUA82457.1 hypothetical protein Ga0061063_1284 [Gulbenkiania indica]